MYDIPMETNKDMQDLRDNLLEQFLNDHDLIVGNTLYVECATTDLIAEVEGYEVFGCGELLVDLTIGEDTDAIWEMVADMYVLHLHVEHGLEAPI